jgi:hypothetical protein
LTISGAVGAINGRPWEGDRAKAGAAVIFFASMKARGEEKILALMALPVV